MSRSKFVASGLLSSLGLLALTSSAMAAATFNAVNVLDPNNGSGITVVNAASNPTVPDPINYPNGVSFTAFSGLVNTAFTAGTGGVLNFDNDLTGPNTTFATAGVPLLVKYGPGNANTLTIARSDANAANGLSPTVNGALLASGSTGLGSNTNFNYSISFDKPLSNFGITFLPRADGGSRTTSLVVHYADNTTSTSSTETTNNGGASTNAIFFGFAAPATTTITSVDIGVGANGFVRFDDLAFITAAVPEPASLGLIGVGAAAFLRRKWLV